MSGDSGAQSERLTVDRLAGSEASLVPEYRGSGVAVVDVDARASEDTVPRHPSGVDARPHVRAIQSGPRQRPCYAAGSTLRDLRGALEEARTDRFRKAKRAVSGAPGRVGAGDLEGRSERFETRREVAYPMDWHGFVVVILQVLGLA